MNLPGPTEDNAWSSRRSAREIGGGEALIAGLARRRCERGSRLALASEGLAVNVENSTMA